MNKRNGVSVLMVLLLAVVGISCKKAQELAKYKDKAMELAGKYKPQLKELAGKLDGLAARGNAIPSSVPGAADLNKLIAKNKDKVGKLSALVDNLPSNTAAAIKSGKKDEVEKVITGATTDLSTGVPEVTADVATATTQMAELEAKAAAAPPAADGTAVPADGTTPPPAGAPADQAAPPAPTK